MTRFYMLIAVICITAMSSFAQGVRTHIATGGSGKSQIGQTFQNNSVGFLVRVQITSSVDEIVDGTSNVKLGPNPAVDMITISSDKMIKHVNIYDNSGNLVHSVAESSTSMLLNISKFSNGMYVIKTSFQDGTVSVNKMIKNK